MVTEPKWPRTQTTQGQFIFALILRRLILRVVGGYVVAVGGARGTAGGDSAGSVRYWRVPREVLAGTGRDLETVCHKSSAGDS